MNEAVAVLGIGAMGHGMAASALRVGLPVIVWNRTREATRDLAGRGAQVAALAPGAIWAQMSTIGVAGIDRVAALAGAERPDVILLDAPVSGSKDPAERGELTIFVSGPVEARPRVAPLLGALGHRTVWVGETGAGTRLKLVNNTWLAFANEAVAACGSCAPAGP